MVEVAAERNFKVSFKPDELQKLLEQRRVTWVERCIAWLKEARAIATRFEKLALHYLSSIHVVMIKRYLKLFADRPWY